MSTNLCTCDGDAMPTFGAHVRGVSGCVHQSEMKALLVKVIGEHGPLIEALLLADRQTLPEHIAKLVADYVRQA